MLNSAPYAQLLYQYKEVMHRARKLGVGRKTVSEIDPMSPLCIVGDPRMAEAE